MTDDEVWVKSMFTKSCHKVRDPVSKITEC